jgi:hypothetical protein
MKAAKRVLVSAAVTSGVLLATAPAVHASGYDPGNVAGGGSPNVPSVAIAGAVALGSGLVLTALVRRQRNTG